MGDADRVMQYVKDHSPNNWSFDCLIPIFYILLNGRGDKAGFEKYLEVVAKNANITQDGLDKIRKQYDDLPEWLIDELDEENKKNVKGSEQDG